MTVGHASLSRRTTVSTCRTHDTANILALINTTRPPFSSPPPTETSTPPPQPPASHLVHAMLASSVKTRVLGIVGMLWSTVIPRRLCMRRVQPSPHSSPLMFVLGNKPTTYYGKKLTSSTAVGFVPLKAGCTAGSVSRMVQISKCFYKKNGKRQLRVRSIEWVNLNFASCVVHLLLYLL